MKIDDDMQHNKNIQILLIPKAHCSISVSHRMFLTRNLREFSIQRDLIHEYSQSGTEATAMLLLLFIILNFQLGMSF